MFSLAEKLIAYRNLRPKKKEGFLKVISTFSFIGIMLGVAILIIVMSVMNGFRTDLTNKILGFNPHIIIKPYESSKIENIFINQINDSFEKIEVRKSYTGEAVVMVNDYTKGILAKGIDTDNKKNLDFLKSILIEGTEEDFKSNELIIGKELAFDLNLKVGDKINLLSSSLVNTPFGNLPKQENYEIKGIFNSGFYEFDKNIIFLELSDSLIFFDKNNDDISLEIYLENPLEADVFKENIQKINTNLYVYSWIDLNKSFFSALKVERNVMFIILTLIIVVAAFNIISGLTILIKNKTKEIAILKTMGLTNKSIIKSFFLTGFVIGLSATIAGTILGVLFSHYIESIRIFLSYVFNVEIFPNDIYFLDRMPSEINPVSIVIIFILALITTVLASLIPAMAISKMDPIKALKYE
ncbi:MAG: lipoprotein-releasing ABC transporter permease subunit [Pelagibacteraceae bacterium]